MKILTLDIGQNMGWALSVDDSQILSGCEDFKPTRFEGGGMSYLRFKRFLDKLLEQTEGIDAVYFEEVRFAAYSDAHGVWSSFLGVLTAWCEHRYMNTQTAPMRLSTPSVSTARYKNAASATVNSQGTLRPHNI